jgi:hypothetical protein
VLCVIEHHEEQVHGNIWKRKAISHRAERERDNIGVALKFQYFFVVLMPSIRSFSSLSGVNRLKGGEKCK